MRALSQQQILNNVCVTLRYALIHRKYIYFGAHFTWRNKVIKKKNKIKKKICRDELAMLALLLLLLTYILFIHWVRLDWFLFYIAYCDVATFIFAHLFETRITWTCTHTYNMKMYKCIWNRCAIHIHIGYTYMYF